MNAPDTWFNTTTTDTTKTAEEWHTVLAGGLREGGHHYFALDVTDPDGRTFGANSSSPIPYPSCFLEFPNEADAAGDHAWMGETWGKPIITKVKLSVLGDHNSGAGYERAVAIMTGGYAAISDPNPDFITGVASTYAAVNGTGGRSLWEVDLKTGDVIAAKTFDGGAADNATEMEHSILGTPTLFDLNFDGFADVLYLGDRGGRLFKWVITDVGVDNVAAGLGARTQAAWKFKQIFQADINTTGGVIYWRER